MNKSTIQAQMNELIGNDATEPCVFVTTYSLYNNGDQFKNNYTGFWITVQELQDNEELIESSFDIQDPTQAQSHEYMYTDYDCFPESMYSESHIDIDAILDWNDYSDDNKELAELYCEIGRILPSFT